VATARVMTYCSYSLFYLHLSITLNQRPYASKVPGIPQITHFNLQTLEYKFQFTNYPQGTHPFSSVSVSPEVEVYIPNYHYKQLHLDIRVSDGDWRYVRSRQTLYWRVKDWTTEGIEHSLRIRIVDNNDKQQGMGNWTVDVWNNWGPKVGMVVIVIFISIFLGIFVGENCNDWIMSKWGRQGPVLLM